MGKIIAVANQKGGVGKTTTTVNLSACLAEAGKSVLLCDLDPQGNSTSGLGINKRDVKGSMYNVLVDGAEIDSVVLKTKERGLFIIPSHMDLAGAEVEMVSIPRREFIFKESITKIKDKYDYIIIDCPPSLGLLTINALAGADSVLVPIQCEYYALEGLSQLTNTIRQVKKLLNPSIELEGVLMTMFDGRTNLSIQVVEETKKFFPQKVYKTIIPRNVRLSEAPSFGRPIIVYDNLSRGAECYRELAHEVLTANRERSMK